MNRFNDLPRDIQLKILSHLDIDGRIKCKIIRKLKIPNYLSTRIHKILIHRINAIALNDRYSISEPYNTYVTIIGQSSPNEWLDRWYSLEFPLIFNYYDCYTKNIKLYNFIFKEINLNQDLKI